jgi:hypothetical protein
MNSAILVVHEKKIVNSFCNVFSEESVKNLLELEKLAKGSILLKEEESLGDLKVLLTQI